MIIVIILAIATLIMLWIFVIKTNNDLIQMKKTVAEEKENWENFLIEVKRIAAIQKKPKPKKTGGRDDDKRKNPGRD